MRLRGVLATAALVVAGAPVAWAVPGVPAAPGVARSCAWSVELAPEAVNALYPDTAARYWTTELPAVPGETLTIDGRYPHARYISYNSYDAVLQATDGLDDLRIAPERASTNPFLPGADRRARRRDYRVRVVLARRPAHPAPNTLYTTSSDGRHSARTFAVIYRVYRPDRGRDLTGGVGLPSVTVHLPGGGSYRLPDCPYGLAPSGRRVDEALDAQSPPWPRGTGLSGLDPPVWYKFYNAQAAGAHVLLDNQVTGTRLSGPLAHGAMSMPSGGLANNADNAYVYTVRNSAYGAELVLHGRLPTFPRTFDGEPTMGTGQVRYWSLCTEDPATQRVIDCLVDDQVVTDAHGFYTVVVSEASQRPADVRPRCGLDWLDAGSAPTTVLILRNMLAAASFRQSVQAARFGHERADMGAYYPVARYASPAAVAALGCAG